MNAMLRPIILLTALTFAASTVSQRCRGRAYRLQERRCERKALAESAGYAIFPTVAKGGLGIGAAHGKGRVYDKEGKHISAIRRSPR